MSITTPEVWMMTSDGHDLIRANAIVAVRLEDDGSVQALLADAAQATATLVARSTTPPPHDFHRQMIRTVAELADSSGAQLVRAHHDDRGWRWVTEPL
jgi:hypothetical protein